MIFACNKMDSNKSLFSEARFDEVTTEVSNYVKKIGYSTKSIAFVPISGK